MEPGAETSMDRRPIGKPQAIVLLSGGLDSATVLAIAHKEHNDKLLALSFDYGQRHSKELECANALAMHYNVEHIIIDLDLASAGGSALTDASIKLPKERVETEIGADIPVTYVPARNLLFLSYALAFAEGRGARQIYIGVNALDYSGYPDCRPEFMESFQVTANLGTKAGVEGNGFIVLTPLLEMTKADIVATGNRLGVPFELTWSCYAGGESPCGECDSCLLRHKGFHEANVIDPTIKMVRGETMESSAGTTIEQNGVSNMEPTIEKTTELTGETTMDSTTELTRESKEQEGSD